MRIDRTIHRKDYPESLVSCFEHQYLNREGRTRAPLTAMSSNGIGRHWRRHNVGRPADEDPNKSSHMQHGETEACLPVYATDLADKAA